MRDSSLPTPDLDDPDIAALLDFEPVPRRNRKEGGWSAEMQRLFIAKLAVHGSPGKACDELGMYRSGIDKVFKSPGADSFREAWTKAVELAERRRIAALEAGQASTADLKMPFVDNRRKGSPAGAQREEEYEPPELSEEEKITILAKLGVKFLKKVAVEREARLAGEIAAADFYLRQATALEVAFDLLAQNLGLSAFDTLVRLRAGGHDLLDIADTPFVRALDQQRRAYWAAIGDPPRPEAFREDYLEQHGLCRTEISHAATGAMTVPARGYTAEQWAAMNHDEQKGARQRQFDEDAAAQVEWEARAREAWEASRAQR